MSSRLVPFTVAGLVCFSTAFLLGAGFWYFFGTTARDGETNTNRAIVQNVNQNSVESNANLKNPANTSTISTPIALQKKPLLNEVEIAGGQVKLGGGDTNTPERTVAVADFAIGETEVSNSQYAEFIESTGYKPPSGWLNGKFPPGTGDEPAVGMSWEDANQYCKWLSGKLGVAVRLPSEAEWVRAARGDTNYKYPWGNEWNDEAAQSTEIKGKIRPVKTLDAGRSPFGVYEMVGNVWEWTSDLALDQAGQPKLYEKSRQRVIKGGSAKESRTFLTVLARAVRPENKPSETLGFRYVIAR